MVAARSALIRLAVNMRSWKILAIAWFSLQAAAVPFHGRVVDDRTDSPVYSALLRVIRPSPREVIADLETDRAGRFSADEIPAGEYRLEISKANFQPTIMDIQWSASTQQDFHIRLVHLGTIAGKILDSQGQPVRNAIVVTFDMGERPARPVGSYVQVDAKGEYRAFGLR